MGRQYGLIGVVLQIILTRRAEVLEVECELSEVHSLLSKLPPNLRYEQMIALALQLFQKHPPATLLANKQNYKLKQRSVDTYPFSKPGLHFTNFTPNFFFSLFQCFDTELFKILLWGSETATRSHSQACASTTTPLTETHPCHMVGVACREWVELKEHVENCALRGGACAYCHGNISLHQL